MLTGDASHQVGLDADVWLTPMPDHTLSREDREAMSAVDMVAEDGLSVDRSHWTSAQAAIIKGGGRGARGRPHLRQRRDQEGAVRDPQGRAWMKRVRAYWGHKYHFHIRIKCPAETALSAAEPPAPGRRLRQVARLVVHPRGAAPERRSGERTADDGGTAAGMPNGGAGEMMSHAFGVAAREARVVAEPCGERQNQR